MSEFVNIFNQVSARSESSMLWMCAAVDFHHRYLDDIFLLESTPAQNGKNQINNIGHHANEFSEGGGV